MSSSEMERKTIARAPERVSFYVDRHGELWRHQRVAVGMARVEYVRADLATPAPAAGTIDEREAAWREALEYANKMLIQAGDRTLHMGLALEHLREFAALTRNDGVEEKR